jgi:hypothetical protein
MTKKEILTHRHVYCVIWESNPGLPDAARMATENFTTKPITLLIIGLAKMDYIVTHSVTLFRDPQLCLETYTSI